MWAAVEFMLLVIHKQDGMIVSCAADVVIEWEFCWVIASSGIQCSSDTLSRDV